MHVHVWTMQSSRTRLRELREGCERERRAASEGCERRAASEGCERRAVGVGCGRGLCGRGLCVRAVWAWAVVGEGCLSEGCDWRGPAVLLCFW